MASLVSNSSASNTNNNNNTNSNNNNSSGGNMSGGGGNSSSSNSNNNNNNSNNNSGGGGGGQSGSMREYCLRWNNHQPNMVTFFGNLYSTESMVDVTLVSAEGKKLQAHKLVLSACSPYFQV
jgi:hypothetical protein